MHVIAMALSARAYLQYSTTQVCTNCWYPRLPCITCYCDGVVCQSLLTVLHYPGMYQLLVPTITLHYLPAAFEIARWSPSTVRLAKGVDLAVALNVLIDMPPPRRAQRLLITLCCHDDWLAVLRHNGVT